MDKTKLRVNKAILLKRSTLECLADDFQDIKIGDVFKTLTNKTYKVVSIISDMTGNVVHLEYYDYWNSDIKSLKEMVALVGQDITLVTEEERKQAERNACYC